MPSHEYDAGSRTWKVRLDDNSLVSAAGLHCVQPFNGPNGFVFFTKVGNTNTTVARKISGGTEYSVVAPWGAAHKFASDGSRYVIAARRWAQGKYTVTPADLVALIMDTNPGNEGWLNFATLGQPTLNIFREVGSGQKPNYLWVQNGRQVSGFEGSDPDGVVLRFDFISATLIDYVIHQRNASGLTTGWLRMQRTFTLATGTMSAASQIASHTYTQGSPTFPTWLHAPA